MRVTCSRTVFRDLAPTVANVNPSDGTAYSPHHGCDLIVTSAAALLSVGFAASLPSAAPSAATSTLTSLPS